MPVTALSLFKRFGGTFINKDSHNQNRLITIPSFTRLGMELNDVFMREEILSVIVLGKAESNFLDTLTEEKRINSLKKIMEKNPPLFLLGDRFHYFDLIKELNEKYNSNQSAIIKANYSSREIITLIGTWLAKRLASWTTIHGSVISIFGEGVLIVGEPGIGKSEITMELLKMNHLFLADDAIDVTRMGNTIVAKSHIISNHFIQIRGLGILNIKEMYGGMKIIDETKITVIIELKHAENGTDIQTNFENLGEKTLYRDLLNIPIPIYILPVSKGRKMSEIVEAAVIDLKLKKQGYNSAKKFDENLKKIIAQ